MGHRVTSVLIAAGIVILAGIGFVVFGYLNEEPAAVQIMNYILVKPYTPVVPQTTIILTGDIMLGRSVMSTSLSRNDPTYPFKYVSEVLAKADIVFGNLENPIVQNCPYSDTGFTFCADPRMIEGLKAADVSVVNLANNHTRNYGIEGYEQTKKYLTDNVISFVGDGNLVTKDIGGTRFGFLGFYFLERDPTDAEYQLIRESEKLVDVLMVMTHWGIEYTPEPTENQRAIAKNIVAAGVDVLVGNHPHWVQSIEYMNGVPVFYSLGNFVMDQAWSEETKTGLAVRLIYSGDTLDRIEKLPVYMKNFAQPEWTTLP